MANFNYHQNSDLVAIAKNTRQQASLRLCSPAHSHTTALTFNASGESESGASEEE
jgi:hypothetical protein